MKISSLATKVLSTSSSQRLSKRCFSLLTPGMGRRLKSTKFQNFSKITSLFGGRGHGLMRMSSVSGHHAYSLRTFIIHSSVQTFSFYFGR